MERNIEQAIKQAQANINMDEIKIEKEKVLQKNKQKEGKKDERI